MAYDEHYADEVRALLQGERGLTEKRMFGGLAFLVDGKMAVVVSGRGLLMIRVDEQTQDRLLARPGITQTLMRQRPMRGWLDADETVTSDEAALAELVRVAVAHVRPLPPKR